MSLANTQSAITQEYYGDLDIQGGQLGRNYEASVTADVALWDLSEAANRYMLVPDAAHTVTLPAVDVQAEAGSGSCIPGHTLWLTNLSSDPTHTLTIVNQAAATVTSLRYLSAVKLAASENSASGWRVIGQMSDVTFKIEDLNNFNLQGAYENTVGAGPEIIMNATNGGLNFEDAPTALGELITLKSNGGADSYMEIGTRVDANGREAYVNLLGASSTQPGSFSVGDVSNTGRNTVAFADSQGGYAVSDLDVFYTGFSTHQQVSGPVALGTSQSAAVYETSLFRNPTVTRGTPAVVSVIPTLQARTVYDVQVEVIGLSTTSDDYVNFKLEASVKPLGAGWKVNLVRQARVHDPNLPGSQLGSAVLSVVGSVLQLSINSPGLAGSIYSFSTNMKFTAHTGLIL